MDRSSVSRQAHWKHPEVEMIIQIAKFVMGFLPRSSNHIKEVVCTTQHVSHHWVTLLFMESNSDSFEESKIKFKKKKKRNLEILLKIKEREGKQMARDSNLSQKVLKSKKTYRCTFLTVKYR